MLLYALRISQTIERGINMIQIQHNKLLKIRTFHFTIMWFLFVYIFSEIYLHITIFKNTAFFLPLLLCLPVILFVSFLCSLFRPTINRIIGGIITFLVCAFCVMEITYYGIFHTLLAPFSSIEMAGNAVDFKSVLFGYIGRNIIRLLVCFIPCFIYPFLCYFKKVGSRVSKKTVLNGWAASIFVYILDLFCMLPFGTGLKTPLYTYFFSSQINYNIETLGLFTGLVKDFEKVTLSALTGSDSFFYGTIDNTNNVIYRGDNTAEPNIISYDFDRLLRYTDDKKVQSLYQYMENEEPTYKNEYTGMFKGYNLIFITAEGWWKYAVRKDLTPTLYKMLNEGFVFENYYTPLWYGSTIGGEFANLTGQIPKESGTFSMVETGENRNNMQFTLSRLLQKQGYGVRAFHSFHHDFYYRNQSHPNMGFKWYASGNGGYEFELDENGNMVWPQSDLKLVSDTFDVYGDESMQPFYTNYMSFSGHADYDEENIMSMRHLDLINTLDLPSSYSYNARCYLACNYELELAVEYLLEHLEEKGLLENTLFVIGPDHIPYGYLDMCSEMAGEDLENNLEWFHSNLVIWSASMDAPIEVPKYCSSIDIFPTVANLMGLEYDSRILAGQDILSDAEQFVIFPDRSWITGKGVYEDYTREFKPFEGVSFEDEEDMDKYVLDVSEIVENKIQFSSDVVTYDYYSYLPGMLVID